MIYLFYINKELCLMRVDAVNSYLSSIPYVEYYPIPAVGREDGHVQEPRIKSVVSKIQVDTIAKAQMPLDFISPCFTPCFTSSKLTQAEMKALEAFIAFERYRSDHVEHSFPGLLKA
jgi:hypothetical protein